MINIYLMYGISALFCILGFIALIMQKSYINSETKKPMTTIKINFFGELKTNYPAVVFVFVAAFFGYEAIEKSSSLPKEEWIITGSLKSLTNENIDWPKVTVRLFPSDFQQADVKPDGKFQITGRIPEGKRFEDLVQRIDFTSPEFSAILYPDEELKRYEVSRDSSLLGERTANSRNYKPVPITKW